VLNRFLLLATVGVAALAPAAARAGQTTPVPQAGGQPSAQGGGEGNVPAPAQATPADPAADAPDASNGDEVVVTGFRQSLRTAINQKRNADRVQEVLAAEDIGKLPEASIAESLARLPGLATNRDRGNGTAISIRGLGPNLVNTLLNGREIVSAEASRNIRYEQYPAELINGASVFKSPTATQVEGAIAGQVDLRTLKPLDFTSTRVVLNARAIYSDKAEDVQDSSPWGYIASASLVTQLLDDTLGVAIGYSGRRQSVATVRTNIFRYTNSFADLNNNGRGNDNIPFGFEGLARGGDDVRHGALATVQWRPDPTVEVNGDFFYSHVKFDETQRGFRVENLPFGNTLTGGQAVTLDRGGTQTDYVTGITTTLVPANASFGQAVRGVNELFFFEDDLYAGGLNGRWRPDGWDIAADIAYSTTRRDQQFLTLRTEPFGFQPTTSFVSGSDSVPAMTINADLTDPSRFRVADFQIPENGGGAPIINDELLSASLDIVRAIDRGPLGALKFGARVTDRSKDYTQRTQFGFVDPAQRRPLAAGLLNDPYRFRGAYAALPAVQSIDILPAVEQLFGPIAPVTSDFDRRSSWVVSEKTYAGYAQLDLDGQVLGLPFTGNLGLRVVGTETLSRSTRVDQAQLPNGSTGPTVLTPVAVPNSFADWLPNLNLTFKPTDKLQVRLGASEAIARAPLDDLNAGFGLFTFGAPAAFGGNPLLEPFRAKQLDATVEWYFDRDSALTVSGFYKDLGTYIVQQVTPIFAPDVNGNIVEGTFRQPVNGSGGTIKGFEVLFQKALTFLPGPLDGLGVYLNYSYTDSSIQVEENDNALGTIQLPGLSKHVGNATLYYSKSGFEARVAFRYRSAYATELGDTDRILFTAPESVLDFQTSYDFPEASALKGVRLLFQANNLTDEPFETYYGDRRLQGRYEKFGRRFLAGVGYQF